MFLVSLTRPTAEQEAAVRRQGAEAAAAEGAGLLNRLWGGSGSSPRR